MADPLVRYPFRTDNRTQIIGSQQSIIRKMVPSEDVREIVALSQAEYDALSAPSDTTLYIIVPNQPSEGVSAGAATVSGVSKAVARSVGASSGAAVLSLVGETRRYATGTSAGAATVSGVGEQLYVPHQVLFDGNDYLERNSNLSGVSDGKVGIFSAWYEAQSSGDTGQRFLYSQGVDASDSRFSLIRQAPFFNNRFRIFGFNASDDSILLMESTVALNAASGRVHILASWDLANGTAHMRFNDVDVLASSNLTLTNDTIDYTQTDSFIGFADLTSPIVAKVNDFYLNLAETMNFSVEANRRKFIDASGEPVYLGATGEIPTGTAPAIAYFGKANIWNAGTNRGTGGDYTMNGAVANA